MFVATVGFIGLNANVIPLNAIPLKCVSKSNQECKVRPVIMNINSNEPLFYILAALLSINVVVAVMILIIHMINYVFLMLIMNIKVFNIMSRANETRHISWHKNCPCKCRLDANVCNDKQHWSNDKCRCECKKLIDNGKRDDGFVWNPSICECDKSCDFAEYLDYANFKCRKRLIDKLVLECQDEILNTTDTMSIADKKSNM